MKIEKCPDCGEEAKTRKLDYGESIAMGFNVECQGCGLQMHALHEAEAVKTWNAFSKEVQELRVTTIKISLL